MVRARKVNKKVLYWIVYVLGFVGILAIVFRFFYTNSRGFVWHADGQTQHLVALVYYSEWMKQIIRNLIDHKELMIPVWDLCIGQGSDIITTLHYYAIGDPLNLLSLLVKGEKMEMLYSGLVVLRIFLAGITFSVYCFGHGKGRKATLTGAYMYCFSSFVLYNAIRHPYFVNPMIYMPLMFLGIDKIYRKEKPYLFVLSTCVAAVSNFYFFYMLVIACVCYAVICYKKEVGRYQWKEIVYYFGKLVMYGVFSLMLAAAIFLPNVMALLFTERMGVENYIPAVFDLKYYERMFASFVSQENIGYANWPGVAVPAFLGLLFLFVKKGKKELKIGFAVLLVVCCIPWMGSLMNGFSYVSYRCSFIASFLLAYIFVSVFADLAQITKIEKCKVFGLMLVYIGVVFTMEKVQGDQLNYGISLLLLSMCCVFVTGAGVVRKNIFAASLLFLTCASIGWSAYCLYSPDGEGYVFEYLEKNVAVERASNTYNSSEQEFTNPSDLLKKRENKDSLARLETYGRYDASQNSAMLQRVNGTSFYFSMVNPNVSRFHKEMGLIQVSDFEYRNLDCRSYLQALNNIKYFVAPSESGRKYTSVLFQNVLDSDGQSSLYEAGNSLGFAYAYDSYIPRTVYENMNCVEKQEAVLQAAVINDEKAGGEVKEGNVDFSYVQKDYRVEPGKNVKIEDGKIKVLKDGASVTILFEGVKNCETYILIEGFAFDPETQWHEKQKKAMEKADKEKLKQLKKNVLYRRPVTDSNIYVSTDASKGNTYIMHRSKRNSFYCGIEDYLWNLGYGDQAASCATITFEKKGEYALDSLAIYCQSVNDLTQKMDNLKVEGGDSFVAGVNSFSGKVVLDETKYLCFSIPYSKGWKVYVNGEEKELLQTNTMFMSVLLDEGAYDIQLKYRTPYLLEGVIGSIAGWLILAVMIMFDIKKGKKKQL